MTGSFRTHFSFSDEDCNEYEIEIDLHYYFEPYQPPSDYEYGQPLTPEVEESFWIEKIDIISGVVPAGYCPDTIRDMMDPDDYLKQAMDSIMEYNFDGQI